MIATIEHHTRCPTPRGTVTAYALLGLVVAGLAAPVAASAELIVQVDGMANVGYTATTSTLGTTESAFAELRPGLMLQSGSPRLVWRLAYVFDGNLTLDDRSVTYSNAGQLTLAAELTNRSALVVSASVTQGNTAFQLTQRAADAGEPSLRAPANPSLLMASVTEVYALEASRYVRFRQSLTAAMSGPQDSIREGDVSLTGSFSLDRVYGRDSAGVEYRPAFAWLRLLTENGGHYASIRNALLARWNHDFDAGWNGTASAGVEQALTRTGNYPLSIAPTGSVIVRYTGADASASFMYTHGAATDLQTGTVSVNDVVTARGQMILDPARARTVGASVGFLRARPLGDIGLLATSAGVGDAVQADVGISWGLSEAVIGTARYTVAYQFDQPSGIKPSLAHVLLLGVTARYRNTKFVPPVPSIGERVDGSDAVGFPGSHPYSP